MTTVRFIASLYYNYYSKGPTATVAYIKTIGAMVLLSFIVICDILVATNLEYILPFDSNDSKGSKYLKIALYTLPLFVLFFVLFPEKRINKLNYPYNKVRKGRTILLFGTIAVILSLPTILIIKYKL